MSSSEEEERDTSSNADEQWDDMAIVRAFEDALKDQHQRAKVSSSSRKNTAKLSRDSKKKNSRRVSLDDDDAASSTVRRTGETTASPAFSFNGAPATSNGHWSAAAGVPQHPQASQHGAPVGVDPEVFQLAYAQAYANLQAQQHAWAYQQQAATTVPQQYPTGYGYGYEGGQYASAGYQTPYAPQYSQPQMPASMPVPPFAAMPGAGPNAAGTGDDGLSNVLLAWYQSGYYTGRFQAMQEMKARERR